MIDSSSSSPPMRIDWLVTMPPSATTATSVVPPPMSTTMFPVGSCTGRPTPMAAGAGPDGGAEDRPALDPGDARRDADHHPRLCHELAPVHLLHEVAQHLLGGVGVIDKTVLEGPDRLDVAGGAN